MSSTKQPVIVLGAGMIGSAMAQDLAAAGGLEVHIADLRPESLDRVAKKIPVQAHLADLGNPEAVRALLKGFRLAIGALPSVIGLQSVKASIEAGCDIVDISFMAEDARALDALARERGVTAVTDCGVAPGLTNMVAAHAAKQFDACERIEMSVGGLPAIRRWPFNYKAGFAPWDVIEIYTRPATVMENGRLVVKEAMADLELIDVRRSRHPGVLRQRRPAQPGGYARGSEHGGANAALARPRRTHAGLPRDRLLLPGAPRGGRADPSAPGPDRGPPFSRNGPSTKARPTSR